MDQLKILVADDEKHVREVFFEVLSYHLPHIKIDLVVNGAEVVEAFRSYHYSVILIDVHMPLMDGVQAYKKVCEICHEEKIEEPSFVFCTGYDPPELLKDMIESNLKHCILRKPVNNDDLVNALRTRL